MAKRLNYSPETSRIEELPDDILLLVLPSLSNLAEITRTSILSRRWRNLWHNITCLDFDATTVLPMDRLTTSHAWYIAWVNKVIDARVASLGLPSVKKLRILYELDESQGRHIDSWISFAISNRVETLHLEFSPYGGLIFPENQYKLSEESWFKAPSGLSNIKCLKSLTLSCVNVSKQFIEFILSSCTLLEELSLVFPGTCNDLDIVSGVPDPLRLRRLKIDLADDFAVTRLCAPYLTSFYLDSSKFNPQKIDVPMLTDLIIGSKRCSQHIMKYLEHFWTYIPQLEKLDLIMSEPQRFRLKQKPELVKLKYLKIRVDWDTDPIFYRIVNFINGCPLLETFAFEVFNGEMIPSQLSIRRRNRINEKWRKVDKDCYFKCLKVLELYGGDGKTIDQEVVRCIISKAPNLEKLTVGVRNTCRYPIFLRSRPELIEVVEAKVKELCQGSPAEISINCF